MDAYDLRNKFFDVQESIMEDVRKKLEHEMTSWEISKLSGSDIARDALLDFLMSAMTDEKLKSRIVNQVSKQVKSKYKERVKKEREEYNRNLKLWNKTQGKIPCLNECGYHDNRTKADVLAGHNTFICAKCCKEHEDDKDWSWSSKIFQTKSVYKIFGIN